MFDQFLQKAWAVAEPTLLAAIGIMCAFALSWLKKHLDAATQTRVIAETVAAVDILSTGNTTGAEKKAVVEKLLDEDPRVKDYTDQQIEAAVRALPPQSKAAPCPPGTTT